MSTLGWGSLFLVLVWAIPSAWGDKRILSVRGTVGGIGLYENGSAETQSTPDQFGFRGSTSVGYIAWQESGGLAIQGQLNAGAFFDAVPGYAGVSPFADVGIGLASLEFRGGGSYHPGEKQLRGHVSFGVWLPMELLNGSKNSPFGLDIIARMTLSQVGVEAVDIGVGVIWLWERKTRVE